MSDTEPRYRFMERDIDEELVWALHCNNPSLDQVRELVVRGANVNARDADVRDEDCGTMLMHAVFDRRVPKEIVQYLVEQGAEVKAINHNGDSVLMRALWNRNLETETVELLLSRGADVNVVNNKGDTALLRAVSSSKPQEKIVEIIRLLVEDGADVNAVDSLGNAVIMNALANVPKLPMAAIEYLIGHGAVIDYTDEELLPAAVMCCQPEAIAFLLNNGTNPNVVLDESGTVLDWVEDFTRFLLGYKAEDEVGENVRRKDIERLSAIYKLLVQAGAKRGRELVQP